MTPEQFVYWLQGVAETSEVAPTDKQWVIIKEHLAEVFTKVTPDHDAGPEPLSAAEFNLLRDGLRSRRSAPHRRDELIC